MRVYMFAYDANLKTFKDMTGEKHTYYLQFYVAFTFNFPEPGYKVT